MANPEYLICLECETPCYTFEWEDEKLTEVLCTVCGNDDPDQFALPEEIEEMSGEEDMSPKRSS